MVLMTLIDNGPDKGEEGDELERVALTYIQDHVKE